MIGFFWPCHLRKYETLIKNRIRNMLGLKALPFFICFFFLNHISTSPTSTDSSFNLVLILTCEANISYFFSKPASVAPSVSLIGFSSCITAACKFISCPILFSFFFLFVLPFPEENIGPVCMCLCHQFHVVFTFLNACNLLTLYSTF